MPTGTQAQPKGTDDAQRRRWMADGSSPGTSPGRSPEQLSGRAGIVIVAVGAFIVLLAAGTAVLRPFADGSVDHGSELIRALIGTAAAAVVVGGVAASVRRRQAVQQPGRASGVARAGKFAGGVTGAALALVALITIAVGATAGIATLHVTPGDARTATVTNVDRPTPPPPPSSDDVAELDAKPINFPSWLTAVVAILATIAALVAVFVGLRSIRIPTVRLLGRLFHGGPATTAVEDPEIIDLEAAADSFSQSAAMIDDDSDPRRAIIAAYARLLARLEEAGCSRRAAEAPEEHLRRSLRQLHVEPGAMELVVGKFLVARFSTHHLAEADRDQVRRALSEAAAQLRAGIEHRSAERQPLQAEGAS